MASGEITITLPEDLPPESLEAVLNSLPADAAVGVRTGEAAAAAAPGSVDAALNAAIDAAGGFGAALSSWAASLTEATGGTGPLVVVLLSLLVAAIAYGIEWGVVRFFPPRRSGEDLDTYRERLIVAVRYGVRQILRLILFVAAGTLLAQLLIPEAEPARALHRLTFANILVARVLYMIARVLFRPDAPDLRPAELDDAGAKRMMRGVLIVILATAPAPFFRDLVMTQAATGPSGVLPATAISLIGALFLVWFFLYVRKPISGLIVKALTREEDEPTPTTLLIARNWHWFYIVFVAINALFALRRVLLDTQGQATGGMPNFILAMAPFLIAGVVGWRREAEAEGRSWVTVSLLALLQGVVAVGAAALLLKAWGLPILAQPGAAGLALFVPSIVRAAAMAAVGYALWIAVASALSPVAGGDGADDDGIPDEENVQGGSRLETIAPILRGFALAAIAIVTGMMALSALGVEIAPMLAGAGVLGLAIGFGAQKLVADIISGIFYLYEDSFRIGEYIVTDEGKGVVEKISLRSARLRHHRGPVFTIPFSSMGTIQNHSRDWVKVKFTFQVPSDTDLEMVRKLIKKVGAELEADPELEGKFLEPLKSQGAVDIQGHSYVIGCKYTTKPGQQFVIRRRAFAALQKALQEKGVKLYAPRIMFDASDDAEALAHAMSTGQAGGAAPG